ncbi:forkhead box protein R1 [Pseudoliparis swirei]|uniref:forkhead box protein R1 n=1 Tax=Pseudoliparis swirei TaxID=2059687 RepID=UPI0024BD921A|nr:forkhead box protein R1 [Pseudoliparis swirei]
MSFRLKTGAGLLDLHCSLGLTDWDMDTELKLSTTTDQLPPDEQLGDPHVVQSSARTSRRKEDFIWSEQASDSSVKPSLWLLVNPSIACPLRYQEPPAGGVQPAQKSPAETRRLLATEAHVSGLCGAPLGGEGLPPPYPILDEDVSCRPAKNGLKGRTPTSRAQKALKPGSWPRPPVNYCILIALALKSSLTGSLKVQQIYNFTREHFPFFQTAPDGWKNTIRHNLCFNSSFRKTCNQLCRDGKRKSCFWHLTLDGHRRLRDEVRTLAGEAFGLLERSMARPDVIQSLFALG